MQRLLGLMRADSHPHWFSRLQDMAAPVGERMMAVAWKLFDLRRPQEALKAAHRAAPLHPDRLEAESSLVWFELAADETGAAEARTLHLLAQHPGHAIACWYLGLIRQRQNDPTAALAAFQRAVSLDPALAEAQVSLGWLLVDRQETAAALKAAEAAVAAAALPHRLCLLGWCRHLAGDANTAAGIFDDLIRQQPDNRDFRTKGALVFLAAGQPERGEALLCSLSDPTAEETATLARCLLALDRPDEAAALARKLGDSLAGWQIAGALAARRDDRSGEIGAVRQQHRLRPDDAPVRRHLAALLTDDGQTAEAEALMAPLLQADPPAAADLITAARLHQTRNRPEAARRLLLQALRQASGGPALARLAEVLNHLGRPMAGWRMMRLACRRHPQSPEVWQALAQMEQAGGNHAAAQEACRRAMTLAPDNPHLPRLLIRLTLPADPHAALRLTTGNLRKNPASVGDWLLLAEICCRLEDWTGAVSAAATVLRLQPQSVAVLPHLTHALDRLGRTEEAETQLQAALERQPERQEIARQLAACRQRLGRFADALPLLEGDTSPDADFLRAALLMDRHGGASAADNDAACEALIASLRQQPHETAARLLLLLAARGHEAARQALSLIPAGSGADLLRRMTAEQVSHGNAYDARDLCALAEAEGAETLPHLTTRQYLRFMLGEEPLPDLLRSNRQLQRRLAAASGIAALNTSGTAAPNTSGTAALQPARPRPDGRLKILYLAPYLHASLLLPVLARHDPQTTEILVCVRDPYRTAPLLPDYCRTLPFDPAGLEGLIAAEEPDVLVDTVGPHGLEGQQFVIPVLHRRLAPVQIGWLGANWATGCTLYDAMILDDAAAPDRDLPLYEEEIIRLPGGQWAWQPPPHAPDPGPCPAEATGRLTFGISVRGLRFSAAVMDCWAKVLAQVPHARLAILGAQIRDGRLRRLLSDALHRQGVTEDRLLWLPPRPLHGSLRFYQDVDIVLDCFPCGGGLSSLDALWMGVPVITLSPEGQSWSGARQGASILTAIGRSDWIAATPAGYVALAAALAADPAARARWRTEARQQIAASPLCDGRRVADALVHHARRLLSAAAAPAVPSAQTAPAFPAAPAAPIRTIIILPGLSGTPTRRALASLADELPPQTELLLAGATLPPGIGGFRALPSLDAALQAAGGGLIFILEGDAILLHGALSEAETALSALPETGAVAGRVIGPEGDDPDAADRHADRRVAEAPDGLLLFRAALLQRLAGPHAAAADLRRAIAAQDGILLHAPRAALHRPGLPRTAEDKPRRPPPPLPALKRILLLDNELPLPLRGGGLPRARQMVGALAGEALTLLPLWRPVESRPLIRASLPPTVTVITGCGADGLEAFLDKEAAEFDRLIVSRPPNMAFVGRLKRKRPDLFRSLPVIYDAEAIFARREIGERAVRGRPLSPAAAARLVAAEIALAEEAATVLCVSEQEAAEFRAAGHNDVRRLTHPASPRHDAPGPEKRTDMLFVGALVPDTPNEDSLLWIAGDILPLLPETVRLTVVGDNRSSRLAALAGPRLRFAGTMADLTPAYDAARLFLAPTRFGAGVPVKVIEAAAAGLPVVATPLLQQQLGWQADHHLLTATTPQQFAAQILRLMTDDTLWRQLQTGALQQIAEHFSPEDFRRTLLDVVRG
jgi:predicted O-linked N-acetylglucosamine transferase (SPINDLY family)/glycosyltransferase involved in cell wall biosynthesis